MFQLGLLINIQLVHEAPNIRVILLVDNIHVQ